MLLPRRRTADNHILTLLKGFATIFHHFISLATQSVLCKFLKVRFPFYLHSVITMYHLCFANGVLFPLVVLPLVPSLYAAVTWLL